MTDETDIASSGAAGVQTKAGARLAIFACMIVIVASLCWVLFALAGNSLTISTTVSALVFACFWLAWICIRLSARTAELENRIGSLSDFEAGVDLRLTAMESGLELGTTRTIETVVSHIAKLEERIDQSIINHSSETTPPTDSQQTLDTFVDKTAGERGAIDATDKPADDNAARRKQIRDALSAENLTLHLQPIVELPSRRPRHFDAFMRLKIEGHGHMDPVEFASFAEDGGVMTMIDRKVLFSSSRMLRTLSSMGRDTNLFYRLSRRSITDNRSFDHIRDFLQANVQLAGSLVIEISQRDFVSFKDQDISRVAEIAGLGFHLALADIQDLSLDGEGLATLGFRFAKVPASILLYANISGDGDGIHPSRLVSILAQSAIDLVGTGVEKESEVIALIDLGVTASQGLLFAPPRPVKADLLKAE